MHAHGFSPLARDLPLDFQDHSAPLISRRLGYAGLACAAVVGLVFAAHRITARDAPFATEPARTGDLTVTVTATGTLVPIDQVDIGSELSGTLRSVDVGYNDHVSSGQVLAHLDDTRLAAQVLQSRAALETANASVEVARANVAEAESQLARLEHVREISGGKVPSEQEFAGGQAAVMRARGAFRSAEAQVSQAQATLDVQQTDLAKAVIRSPIDGIVLTAAARPGQTVAASLQAPVLFTLAQDLKHLELDLAVDEADIGQVHEGQTAEFTVDAWPGRTFPAHVHQVRYAGRSVAGVVTYQVILDVENPDLLLRPGMTVTAEITVRRDEQVLLVPNAALRFAPEDHAASRESGFAALVKGKHSFDVTRAADGSRSPRVWTVHDGHLHALAIEPGPSDGSWTEIAPGAVAPGTPLVVAAGLQRSAG